MRNKIFNNKIANGQKYENNVSKMHFGFQNSKRNKKKLPNSFKFLLLG